MSSLTIFHFQVIFNILFNRLPEIYVFQKLILIKRNKTNCIKIQINRNEIEYLIENQFKVNHFIDIQNLQVSLNRQVD